MSDTSVPSSKKTMAPRKASKTLNLEEKVDLINHHEKTGKSIRDLAAVFDVSRSQVANVLKRKREYVADYESNAPRDKKGGPERHYDGHEQVHHIQTDDVSSLC